MTTRTASRLAMLAALCVATSAFAHHSFAMFDQSKQVTLKGTVREFQWTNPHAWIHLDVPNPSGGVDSWQVELNSPNNLKRQGWKSTSLTAGEKVTLMLNPLKDGTKGGLFISVTLPDGTVLGDPTRGRGGPINVPAT
ncbi:MAG TPA: DUF6152 family protein [Steroidobacteraceae bacterium]|nr:DUF6152 family protein [Steroidobacteraceae bacterium]